MTFALPRSAAEITPDWLTLALRAGGLESVVVAAAMLTRIGQEQSFTGGAVFRISLTWRGPERGPDSLVAKLSPPDPGLAAAFFAANCREVAFYDRLAGQGVLPVPRAYFHAADARRNASVILLQDLKDTRAVPFAQGFSAVEAGTAVDALAQVHAAFWQHPGLADFDGMALLRTFDFGACWARFPKAIGAILGDAALPPSFLALGDWLAANQNRVFADLYAQGPVTCLHRDLQADNVVF
ncbi:MAG: phosphotransferase, partial [Pseudomonadota bacterium]